MIRVDYSLGTPLPFANATYVRAKDIVRCSRQEHMTAPELIKMHQPVPYYIITIQPNNDNYVVHTDDNWKMERVIRGTFHPIADLVDELQNHPSIGILPKLAAEDFAAEL